jgi:hypothetical protein
MGPKMRLNITDPVKWGNLVKTWATGRNTYLEDGPYPVPQSLAELKQQLAQSGAGTVPDEVKSVQFIVPADHPSLLLILLPAKEAIDEVEAELSTMKQQAAGGSASPVYPLPAFYKDDAWGSDPKVADWEKFVTERIGEYTILQCQ